MESEAVWAAIHAERRALADDLQTLSEPQWATPSLCGEWTVRQVLAHMTATARMSPGKFFGKMIGAGFNFQKLTSKDIAEQMGASPAETLARFAAEIDSSGHPPGPNDSWLGEALVHAEDIRHPLKIQRAYPTECAVQVADFYKGSNLLIGAKKRIDGLTLVATDTDWRHGAGPEVSGPIMSLVLAMTGRKAAMRDLSGPGVQTLESRCS
ncbi:MAG TPA: maleylpyruvate isomerase family mycothiol-dependent enzyme [Chloroflexota bacterium]